MTADLLPLAQKIAGRIGMPWKASDHDDGWGVNIEDGKHSRLFLREDRGRLSINGVLPSGGCVGDTYAYGEEKPTLSITVALDRDPGAIAMEIGRRLLPGYMEALERGLEAIAKKEENAERKDELAKEIARLLGVGTQSKGYVVYIEGGHVRVSSPEHVRFNFTLDPKSAKRVCKLLGSMRKL